MSKLIIDKINELWIEQYGGVAITDEQLLCNRLQMFADDLQGWIKTCQITDKARMLAEDKYKELQTYIASLNDSE